MNPSRVLIIDDHPLFRSGVAVWLNNQPDFVCCGEADSVRSAREVAATSDPHVILLDLRLPDGDGLDLLRELTGQHSATRVLILSQQDEVVYAHRALNCGARGYLMKSEAAEVLRVALETVLRGEVFVSRPVAARLLHNLFPDPVAPMPGLEHLSDRELQVFQLLGSGMGSRQVAERLKISPKTVDTYREHLKEKLGLADGKALLAAAQQWVREGRLDRSAVGAGVLDGERNRGREALK